MLKNYLQMAVKVYLRRKMFTAINLLCIVLTLVVLLMVTAILQYQFSPGGVERKSDRYLQMNSIIQLGKADEYGEWGVGYKLIDQYLRKMASVELVAAITQPETVAVYQPNHVEKMALRWSDAEYWQVMDFSVVHGRVINHEDVDQGRFVVVITVSAAKKLFGAIDPLGQKMNIRSQQFEVIGVVEESYHTNSYGQIWAPISTQASSDYRHHITGAFTALLLAKDPSNRRLIQTELLKLAKSIQSDEPERFHTVVLRADTMLEAFSRGFVADRREVESNANNVLMSIAALMMLFMNLPALNLINLNVGRIMERSAEIGVRKAFGASTMELVWQFLIENILLCLIGCALALLSAQGLLLALSGSGIIPYFRVDINWMVFLYGAMIALIFGVISGVLPAWRMAKLEAVSALKGI
ncbi:MAG: ABC transporter permease [Undibacterium sp.]|nr:ABC transporter permease [Undibacterium sp.]